MTQIICGIARFDGVAPDEALLQRMASAMITPGLHQQARYALQGPVAMAAVRVAHETNDASLDPPALVVGDGSLLAADITIHDRNRLNVPAAPANSSDGVFFDHAIAEQGSGVAASLHGDFAFASWRDGRLTLGRDHFGARPLLYAWKPGQYLAFASMPSALLRTGLAAADIDDGVAARWVVLPAPPPGRTIFRDIRSVPAAHLVEDHGNGFISQRYWRLNTGNRLPFNSDPDELAEEVRRLMAQAVERRLPKSGPGAGHLSGGLDSSSIAVLAARSLAKSGRNYFGYSFREPMDGPGLPGVGDAPVADLVAAAEPAITQVSSISPSLLLTYGQGVDPESMLPFSADDPEEQLLRHATQHHVSVLFSGWGGDQVVSYMGRGAEAELLRAGRFRQLWRHLRAESAATGERKAALMRSTVLMQAIPQRLREKLRRLLGRPTSETSISTSQTRLAASHLRGLIVHETEPDTGDSHRNRRAYTETWYIQTRLESFARQGARHGIVYAYPLLDLDLVEYVMRIPGIFQRNNGNRRVLMRDALKGVLPDDVRLRPEKLQPWPGESERNVAARKQLLALLDHWRTIPIVGEYLDLDFMAQVVRADGDPNAPADLQNVDQTMAFQLAGMLATLGNRSACEAAE